jgi:hypothetical protein
MAILEMTLAKIPAAESFLTEPSQSARHPPRAWRMPFAVMVERISRARTPTGIPPLRRGLRSHPGGVCLATSVLKAVSIPVASDIFCAQTGQHRGQKVPRWNRGRCIFSARPPHVRQGLVTLADWMHGSIAQDSDRRSNQSCRSIHGRRSWWPADFGAGCWYASSPADFAAISASICCACLLNRNRPVISDCSAA